MLILTYHGGKCCGIKTIWGFVEKPEHGIEEALPVCLKRNHDQYADLTNQGVRFFQDAAPKEPTTARLDRYIEYVKEHRPDHIIEVVLAQGSYLTQVSAWGPELEKRGFIQVNRSKNSNTTRMIHVYHLNVTACVCPPKEKPLRASSQV